MRAPGGFPAFAGRSTAMPSVAPPRRAQRHRPTRLTPMKKTWITAEAGLNAFTRPTSTKDAADRLHMKYGIRRASSQPRVRQT